MRTPRSRHVLPVLVALVAASAAVLGARASAGSPSLVALRASAPPSAVVTLRAAGGELVDARLRLWRAPRGAGRAVEELQARGHVSFVQEERVYEVAAASRAGVDPLSESEWWRPAINVVGLTPPGPGVPVTVVDSGLSVQHPEFASRPNTETLNEQEPKPLGGEHGTMVASLVGAPANGVGVVGVYPEAVIRSWDAARGQGTRLEAGEIVSGILAAARAGRGVINLSLGGPRDLAIEYAVAEAIARGSLVVAASGNDGGSNVLSYPAGLPHVLTIGATNRDGAVAPFSSTSPYVDVAAPGAGITVASALENGWTVSSGTSFSAPLVSGAAAWIWTARPDLTGDQVAEVIRRTARDLEPTGRDAASGFGMLDVAAALAAPAPTPDPMEPNDDVDNVSPRGDVNFAQAAPLTTPSRRRATLTARVDRFEDPRDVYRIRLPRNATVTITAQAGGAGDVDLSLFRADAPSVTGALLGSMRLGRAQTRGTSERLVVRTGSIARWAYVVVAPNRAVSGADYRLVVSSRSA
jgi:subtilisin family serine protease